MITLREATVDDFDVLVDLHVRLWARTYPDYTPMPTAEIRGAQWRRAFERRDLEGLAEGWFTALLVEDDGHPVGFSKGIHARDPRFDGELSKIYLEWSHHRRGIGRRLMGETVRRMRARGMRSMILFAEPDNPACAFYEALGGERFSEPDQPWTGAFAWRDLEGLERRCLDRKP